MKTTKFRPFLPFFGAAFSALRGTPPLDRRRERDGFMERRDRKSTLGQLGGRYRLAWCRKSWDIGCALVAYHEWRQGTRYGCVGGVIFTMNFFLEAQACLNGKGGRVWEFFPFGNFASERFFFKSRTAENEVCCERLNSFYCYIMASVTLFCLCPCEARPACWALCSVGRRKGPSRSTVRKGRAQGQASLARSYLRGSPQARNAPSESSNRGMQLLIFFLVGVVVGRKVCLLFTTTAHLGIFCQADFRGRLSLPRTLCLCAALDFFSPTCLPSRPKVHDNTAIHLVFGAKSLTILYVLRSRPTSIAVFPFHRIRSSSTIVVELNKAIFVLGERGMPSSLDIAACLRCYHLCIPLCVSSRERWSVLLPYFSSYFTSSACLAFSWNAHALLCWPSCTPPVATRSDLEVEGNQSLPSPFLSLLV